MLPTKASRGALACVAALTVIAFGACTVSGDDVESIAGEDASADGPAIPGRDAAEIDSAASPGASSDAATSEGGDASDGGDARATFAPRCFSCPAGQKNCGDRCVSIDDPRFGCGTLSCESCYTGDFQNADAKCVAGRCAIASCFAGTADCDGDPANGCEARLDQPTTCGSCTTSCVGTATPLCGPGGCTAACAPPTTKCSSSCIALATSILSCGSCNGPVCDVPNAASSICTGGTCNIACKPGEHLCGRQCCPDDDPNHCGASCSQCGRPGMGGLAACVGGTCSVACAPGFVACKPSTPPICQDLSSDPLACGACGNACAAGTTCIRGACVAPTSVQAISGLGAPDDILVDADRIYWTDHGDDSVWSADKKTLVKTKIAADQGKPYRLASDGTNLYWTSNLGAAIATAPLTGGPVTILYAANQPTGVAVDDTYVYWSEVTTPHVMKAPKVPGTAVELLKGYYADSFASDGAYLYADLVDKTTMIGTFMYARRIEKTTGAVAGYDHMGEAGPVGNIGGVALTGSFFFAIGYWSNPPTHIQQFALTPGGGSKRLDKPFFPNASVLRIRAIAADDCSVYFTGTADGGIWKAGKGIFRHYVSGETIMTVTTAVVDPKRIALDDTYVYWTDSGFIGRVAK